MEFLSAEEIPFFNCVSTLVRFVDAPAVLEKIDRIGLDMGHHAISFEKGGNLARLA